jgi:8-oxo-dGTP pyrophosphatase MutT (NUDIX family)
MDSFNLNKLKEYIPKELPQVQLPRMPTWKLSDDDDAAEAVGDAQEDDSEEQTMMKDEPMILEDPTPIDTGPKSNLDLINECDNFPYYHANPKLYFAHINTYYGLYVIDYPETELGYILPSVVEVFRGLSDWKIDDDERSLTLLAGSKAEDKTKARTKAVAKTTEAMRATEHFSILKGWRNEHYPVYGPNGEMLFSMERSASALFGIVTYGCHMTAYTSKKKEGSEDKELKIWVPQRATNKQTYPGFLDNTVAGGIAAGESSFECLVRESQEEASLPEETVRKSVKSVGTVSYFHIRDRRAGGETRLLQPEIQYVYDLELPEHVVPKPGDTEVAEFNLMTVDEVKQVLADGKFKPNCALVLLDFFVRHGILAEKDPGYIEIMARLHRRLEFPTL